MKIMAKLQGFRYNEKAVDYLIEKHYRAVNRPFRFCQPRDLLMQVANYCKYHGIENEMTEHFFDLACENYFAVM
jgi:hypothetical protein